VNYIRAAKDEFQEFGNWDGIGVFSIFLGMAPQFESGDPFPTVSGQQWGGKDQLRRPIGGSPMLVSSVSTTTKFKGGTMMIATRRRDDDGL